VEDNLNKGFAHYVAEDGGRIVGWCDVVQRGGGEMESMRHRATLGIGVIDGYRGRGLGERLMRSAVEHSWRIGLLRIDLDVRADNLAAIRLYEKFGFRQEGRRPFGLQLDGEYFYLILMELFNEQALRTEMPDSQ
jgi:ribosomal protein S18 acetylase RimI-like enzyme